MIPLGMFIGLLESGTPVDWPTLGVGGALAGIMFFFYRQDRKDNESRWVEIAKDFKTLIQENTQAVTSLRASMDRAGCPLAGKAPAAIVAVPKPELSHGAGS